MGDHSPSLVSLQLVRLLEQHEFGLLDVRTVGRRTMDMLVAMARERQQHKDEGERLAADKAYADRKAAEIRRKLTSK